MMKKITRAVHAGLKPEENHGIPNPPVYHTSTILRSNMEEHRNRTFRYDYGRVGTPTSEAFETSVADLYGSEDSVALPSGLSAIATGVNAVVKAGDSVLFPDSLYGSGRRFAEYILPRNGVKTVFYDPMIDAEGLAQLISKETSLVYIETPGSLTFEMQDTKAIVDTAHAHGCLVACDNTWGTPLYFDAFGHGIDIAIEAGTKYINGHSDVSIGVVAASGESAAMIRKYTRSMGLTVGPDDLYLALRGLRTIGLRLKQSEANGYHLARWLDEQPEVLETRHPGLESHPRHDLWQRDFIGACGLFSIYLDPAIPVEAVDAMANNLSLYGIGASWGGHESLIMEAEFTRSVSPKTDARVLRFYAGLEDPDDLLDDLKAGFERMRKHS